MSRALPALKLTALAIVGAGAALIVWAPWGHPAAADPYAPVFMEADKGQAAIVEALSADGSTVIGGIERHPNAHGEVVLDSVPDVWPFRWTRAGGRQAIPTPGDQPAEAQAVSIDGATVAGVFTDADYRTHAFRWTRAKGFEDLVVLGSEGLFPGGGPGVLAVSPDGETLVGKTAEGAFRWTRKTGVTPLGKMWARAASADASVLVGLSNGPGPRRILRWTAAGGMEDLGAPPGAVASETSISVMVEGLSADGSVLVGDFEDAAHASHAFRWSRAGGFQDLPGGPSQARAVSRDGSVIVGCFRPPHLPPTPVIWQNGGQFQPAPGLGGWCLYAISADGKTVTGRGWATGGKRIGDFIMRLR